MPIKSYRAVKLAGDFPPGLNTSDPAWVLKENETPDGYGFNLESDGAIRKSVTCPTGTTRIARAVTISEGGNDIPYLWHYNRLWNITNRTAATASNLLCYGAEFYEDIYYRQGIGREVFDEDAQPIVAIVPLPPESMYVGKTTGGCILSNLTDARAFFNRTDFIQALALPAANQVVELDGVLYVANANGMTVYENGKTAELSRKIRSESLTGMTLTADYGKRRVIVGTSYVWDAGAEKWFRYDGSTFRFTTRQLASPDWSPFTVDRVSFVIEHASAPAGTAEIKYQVSLDDGVWGDEMTVSLPYEAGKYTVVSESLESRTAARRFQLRVTDLTSSVKLREVLVDVNGGQFDDYSA